MPTRELPALGIIAGQGPLPMAVADAALAQGRAVFVIGIKGRSNPAIDRYDHAWVRFGAIGATIDLLKKNKCRDLVLIGPMKRPTLFVDFWPDLGAIKLLPAIVKLLRQGDDGLLSGVVKYFEEVHGFHIRPAEEVAATLVAPEGLLSAKKPSSTDLADIRIAIDIVRKRGGDDLGQGAVVATGEVLDVEDDSGTDAMLKRVAATRTQGGMTGGVLVKLPKPGQDRRVDLPAIGVATVENTASARLAGIAYEASGALIADAEGVARRADELGIFVIGLPIGTGEGTL